MTVQVNAAIHMSTFTFPPQHDYIWGGAGLPTWGVKEKDWAEGKYLIPCGWPDKTKSVINLKL